MDQLTPRRGEHDDDRGRPEDDRSVPSAEADDAPVRSPAPAPSASPAAPASRDRYNAHDLILLGSQGEEDGGDTADRPGLPSRWLIVAVVLILGLALAWGAYGHWKTGAAAAETQRQQADVVPKVRVAVAKTEDGAIPLSLPGETQPFATAAIYARATGYITDRRVDIGTRVKKGDLLVHISAPDLDQQLDQAVAQLGQVQAALLQAQANVSQAEANLNLAKVNLQRAQALVGQGFETLQNRDQLQANQASQSANLDSARAGVKVADANVKAQQANIDRLKALAGFEDVRAPFDGVVSVRNVDLGTLVNADSATGSPMFTVEADDVLRVLVQVPQNAAVGVRDGLEAKVTVPQWPGRTFVGQVTRSSLSLQSSARTLTVEVDIPNQAGTLRAGLYAYITLDVPRTHPDIVLPAETLIFDQSGTHVAVVGQDDKVKMTPINISRDLGTSIEIDQGPKGGDRVVVNPPAQLRDGVAVSVEADDAPGVGGQGPAGNAGDRQKVSQD